MAKVTYDVFSFYSFVLYYLLYIYKL